MKLRDLKQHIVLGLFVLTSVIAAGPANAATAQELFEDGNRLFRDDLYWAALLRYSEAEAAGMNTPLLHFNTGVAHYKAGQHVRARESLLKSSTYSPLAAISHYNLGLNSYRDGNRADALGWFRRAAAQDDRKDIKRLARRAVRMLEDESESLETITVQQVIEERERKFTNLDFRFRTGAGTDDNVFRSPAEPYVDLSDPTNPTVTPEVQSGVYVPVSLHARYQVNALENEGFFGQYRFGGRFYQDSNLENANEFLQEIAFGSEYHSETEDRETRVYSAFKIAQNEETYFDPDDGLARDINGEDISDRMSYLRYGPEFWGRKRFGRFTFGMRAKGRLYNYEDVELVPAYDHEYWLVGLNTHIRLSQTSLLRLNADYFTRRYGDRLAFELDGTQPIGNPTVRYDYLEASIEARQRITQGSWFSLGYSRTVREDRHVGYNNYVRDEFGVRFNLRAARRFRIEARAYYHFYDYANAFAFHEPTAGRKTLERLTGSLVTSFRMTDSLHLVGEFQYRDVTSSDARLEYGRTQGILSIRWAP